MQTEYVTKQNKSIQNQQLEVVDSVCHTPEESERLFRLFQIFIDIDKQLKKKSNESNI